MMSFKIISFEIREAIVKILPWIAYSLIIGITVAIMPIFIPVFFVILVFVPLFFGRLFDFEPPKSFFRYLFALYFLVNTFWPKYLAIQLPGPDLNPQRIVLLLLTLFFLISFISPITRRWAIVNISNSPPWFYIFITVILFRFASSIFGINPLVSFGPFANEVFEFFVLFLIAYLCFDDYRQAKKLYFMILCAGLIVAAMAISEYFLKKNLFSGITIPGVALDQSYLEQALSDKSRHGGYRSQAAFIHPLLLAEFCTFVLPIAFYFLRIGKRYEQAIAAIGIVLISIAGFTSGSRSALVGVMLVIVLSCFNYAWHLRQSKTFGVIGWFLFIFGVFSSLLSLVLLFWSGVLDGLIYGHSLREAQSTTARLIMYQVGLPAILASPILGYGLGTAAAVVGFSSNGSFSIDSFYLSYALESGVPTLILFLSLIIWPFLKLFGFNKNISNKESFDLFGSVLIAVIGVLVIKSVVSLNGNTYLLVVSSAIVLRSRFWNGCKV